MSMLSTICIMLLFGILKCIAFCLESILNVAFPDLDYTAANAKETIAHCLLTLYAANNLGRDELLKLKKSA